MVYDFSFLKITKTFVFVHLLLCFFALLILVYANV